MCITHSRADNLVCQAIASILVSLGNGSIEQGRIGNALSKEVALRSYIKNNHGECMCICALLPRYIQHASMAIKFNLNFKFLPDDHVPNANIHSNHTHITVRIESMKIFRVIRSSVLDTLVTRAFE
jgi:hypothetical protein